MQNGVSAPAMLARHLGEEHVLGGIAWAGGTLVSPGRIVQKSSHNTLVYGEMAGGVSDRCAKLQAALETVPGLAPRLSADIRAELWEKFVQAAPFSALDALLRWPTVFTAAPPLAAMLVGAMREMQLLSIARGIGLPSDIVEIRRRDLFATAEAVPSLHSSMHYDLIAGARLEIEETIGDAVRMGEEMGVAMPLCAFLYAALLPFRDGAPERG